MAELAGKSVVLKISGTAVALTDEATATTDNKNYQIVNEAKQVIDWTYPVLVEEGGSPTGETYSINYLNGTITFGTIAVRGAITVSGKYLPMSVAAYANSFSRTDECSLYETSVFGNDYKSRIGGLKSASGSLTNIDVADLIYVPVLVSGSPIIIEDRAEAGGLPNRTMAILESVEDAASVDDLQTRSIGWTSTDEFVRLGE